ncbi:hypothetical protein [Streptomyces sp. NPDC051183]|uniref:hypothetical protein n=1 Tax=unclassified Streptomyces TaxID=2593676 RepID=UPI0034433D2E
MRIRHALPTAAAAAAVVLALPGTAHAATGSASVTSGYGTASASWTWAGPGSLSNINLTVRDTKCNANPVYAKFKVYRTNGQYWTTSTLRYDYNGCNGSGTPHNGLSLSDGYNIANIALIICNEEWGTDPCSEGSKSARNPLA